MLILKYRKMSNILHLKNCMFNMADGSGDNDNDDSICENDEFVEIILVLFFCIL